MNLLSKKLVNHLANDIKDYCVFFGKKQSMEMSLTKTNYTLIYRQV